MRVPNIEGSLGKIQVEPGFVLSQIPKRIFRLFGSDMTQGNRTCTSKLGLLQITRGTSDDFTPCQQWAKKSRSSRLPQNEIRPSQEQ